MLVPDNDIKFDRSHTQPNRTYKCNTQELTQGHLLVTIVFNQSFPNYNSTQMGGVWQIQMLTID